MTHGQFLKEVGLKVRAVRKSKKITLEAMAKLCGTNITQLSFIENGKCNWHILTLKNIANVFNIDIKQLL